MNYVGLEDDLFEELKDLPGINFLLDRDYNVIIRQQTKKILHRVLSSNDEALLNRL